jgi:hypothetical protein
MSVCTATGKEKKQEVNLNGKTMMLLLSYEALPLLVSFFFFKSLFPCSLLLPWLVVESGDVTLLHT